MVDSIASLAQDCAKQTAYFFQHQSYDPRSCFELFRRAVLDRDQSAWEVIFSQYSRLVDRWVHQHFGFEASAEESAYFVNLAFEKFWAAMTPGKFSNFNNLGTLLSYLKMCVHSALTDHIRAARLVELTSLADEASLENTPSETTVEGERMDRSDRQKFWAAIDAQLADDKERKLVYASFFLELKPKEIFDLYVGLYDSVDEVYLVKQNVLARLRRRREFLKLGLEGDEIH